MARITTLARSPSPFPYPPLICGHNTTRCNFINISSSPQLLRGSVDGCVNTNSNSHTGKRLSNGYYCTNGCPAGQVILTDNLTLQALLPAGIFHESQRNGIIIAGASFLLLLFGWGEGGGQYQYFMVVCDTHGSSCWLYYRYIHCIQRS